MRCVSGHRYTSVEIGLIPTVRGEGAANPHGMFPPAVGGHRTHASRSRLRSLTTGLLVAALAASIAACGGEASSDANEASGNFPVKVTRAEFPTSQRLGQTSLMRLGVRNTGHKTIPALTVNVSIAGKEGQTSTLPFAIRDPQPDLAQPDRPVWVLSARYPRFAGSSEPAGAETSNQKTYDFGPLKPEGRVDLVWKLNAVKAGRYTLLYAIDAGLSGQAKATAAGGVQPGGSFTVQISGKPYATEVKPNGEVVPIGGASKPTK
jgi:hypothetical protein